MSLKKSAIELRDSVNAGKSSAVEHFEDAQSSAKANAKFGAWEWVYENYESAIDKRPRFQKGDYSALNGVPIGVKDVFNSVTGTTEMGSNIWKGHQAGNDARVLTTALESGVTMLGKTRTAEFAVHALPEVYNPWNMDLTPGTSSSGSAVCVSTGDVPVSLGTQTAGSIIRPASYCGVIGFKPSFGVFPRTGILKTCDPFDSVGYFCSHYIDIQLVFESIRLKGDNYPLIENGLKKSNSICKSSERIRVAKVQIDSSELDDEEVSRNIESFCAEIPDKYSVGECDLRGVLENARGLQELIYHKSLSYYFTEERKSGTRYSKVMNKIFSEGDKIQINSFKEALAELTSLRQKTREFLSQYDLLIAPSTSTTAPKRADAEANDSSLYWTMLQLPSMSLPLFRSSISRMPYGLQLVGTQKYSEPLMFDFLESVGLMGERIEYFEPIE